VILYAVHINFKPFKQRDRWYKGKLKKQYKKKKRGEIDLCFLRSLKFQKKKPNQKN
jgi:hypothetical protein